MFISARLLGVVVALICCYIVWVGELACCAAYTDRGEEDRGEEVILKLLHAWSPRRSPLQAVDTRVVVSTGESKMTRRSLSHRHWSEGWEVQRILYARDPQSGERKVDVLVSFFACMQL